MKSKMLSFQCDYAEGALEEILTRLAETNREGISGYGSDSYCASATAKIRKACNCPNAEVWYLVGGTQTNQIVISSLLADYEGVIAAASGHINTHEAGAIECTGHKVLALPHSMGKIRSQDLRSYLADFYADENHEHMVFPGMVYISHPTEFGTLYSKAELQELSEICHTYDIPLYMDGARLGYGLMSTGTDVTLADIAEICDVFYIGGTKVGALFGEAVVFPRGNAPKHFMTMVKQHGALLAKGWLLGLQFDTLFTDELYFKASRHAIQMADELRRIFQKKGYEFYTENPTNQIFIVLENTKMDELRRQVNFSFWEKKDETHTVVRFATSWATDEKSVRELAELL